MKVQIITPQQFIEGSVFIEAAKSMSTYKTFKRSCTDFRELATARKTTEDTGLTYEQALAACNRFNSNRTARQKRKGTKLEFTEE